METVFSLVWTLKSKSEESWTNYELFGINTALKSQKLITFHNLMYPLFGTNCMIICNEAFHTFIIAFLLHK